MMVWELEWRSNMSHTMRRLVRLDLNPIVTILRVPLNMFPSIKANLPLNLLISLTILRSHHLTILLPNLIVSLLTMPLLLNPLLLLIHLPITHLLLKSLTTLLSHM